MIKAISGRTAHEMIDATTRENGDSLFLMMNRRYDAINNQNKFMEPATTDLQKK